MVKYKMEPKILLEEADFLVIDKPAGWIVNEADTTKEQPVVQTWIKKNLDYQIAKSEKFRSGIVHRLDKETSGVLILAKTTEAFENLQKQFKDRGIQKTYTALAHGVVEPEVGDIDAPTGRLPWNRRRFGVLPGGKAAQTRYRVISNFQNPSTKEKYTLLELHPKTGRTHQIRIHLKHIGHPIVSDEFYAGRKTARNDRKWCPRLFLHASAIEFIDTHTKHKVSVASELPPDLTKAFNSISKV